MSEIVFLNSIAWYWALLFLAFIGAIIFLGFFRAQTKTGSFTRTSLILLRSFLILILLWMLLDPYVKKPRTAEEDWIGVLVDTSESMNVVEKNAAASRLDQVKQFFNENETWKEIQKTQRLKWFRFDRSLQAANSFKQLQFDGKSSQLNLALQEIKKQFMDDPHLLGWIVVSDGNATDVDIRDKNTVFSDFPFPCVTLAVGDETALVPNVSLSLPPIDEKIYVGDRISIPLRWDSNLKEQVKTTLQVFVNDKKTMEKEIDLSEQETKIDLSMDKEGLYAIRFHLAALETEGSSIDNDVTSWLEVQKRKIKVFYAESFYKDENLFKKALEEDGTFEVDFATSLLGFAREKRVPFIQDSLYGLPQSRARLFEYDVIVLSDVKRDLLSQDQVRWIRELVEEEGGALVMVGGVDSFGDGGYVGTEIEKLLPVEISEEYKKDVFLKAHGTVEAPFRPTLTSEAKTHSIMQLVSDQEENLKLWGSAPLLGGYNYVGRLKPSGMGLLMHPSDKSAFGSRVIMSVQPSGRGRVIAFTSDVTPNWGEQFQEWRIKSRGWLYAKFWQNALKWAAQNRLRIKQSGIEVKREPFFAEAGNLIQFQFSIDAKYTASKTAKLRFELYHEDKLIYQKQWEANEIKSDLHLDYSAVETGNYHAHLFLSEPQSRPVETNSWFYVSSSRAESKHLPAHFEWLRKLAKSSGGYFLPISKPQQLDKAMQRLQLNRLRNYAAPFWSRPFFYLLIVLLLCLDWLIRKKSGLE